MNKPLPKGIKKYFWGDDLKELDWENNRDYITKTLLEKGDSEAIRWLLKEVDSKYLKKIVEEKKLDPKSENYWRLYLT